MIYLISSVIILFSVTCFFFKIKKAKRIAYIEHYKYPVSLKDKIKNKYPHLTDEQVMLVFKALTDYFYLCNQAKKRMISMPSQIVDDAWHEFILFTRLYELFCKKAMGGFLHHTPAEAMQTPTLAQEGIKRAWRLACAKEKINPATPDRLPLIFAIDSLLDIEAGYSYSLNCKDKSSPLYGSDYCATHIGCTSGCSGDTASSSDSPGFFDGFGDSGGDGCGGGGCGGD